MNGVVIMVISSVVLGGAYLLYGRYLAKKWGIDPKAKTPPTKWKMVLIMFQQTKV